MNTITCNLCIRARSMLFIKNRIPVMWLKETTQRNSAKPTVQAVYCRINKTTRCPAIPGLSGRSARGTRYTWIFPNMTFACSTEALWIYEAYPVTPTRCQVFQTLCFPQASVDLPDFESKVKFYYERFDAAVEEDRVALENQQLGLNSPYAMPGRYAAGMEPSVAAFASWYAQQLQEVI